MVEKKLYQTLQNDDLCLVYSGIFSDSMTDKIIDLSSVYLDRNPVLSKMRKRTSFLVAECFQNVVRHGSAPRNPDATYLSSGSFMVRFIDNKSFIASKNVVPVKRAGELRRKIEEINSLDQENLKATYKGILAEGIMSEKGGAGLGLIEMARKTRNKLHFSFEPLDDEYNEFYLMLILEQQDEPSPGRAYVSELKTIIDIFKQNEALKNFMLYHGDYGDLVINPVIDMITNTMDSISTNLATRMKLYHAAIEMMHNINHYSYRQNGRNMGMLVMGKQWDSPVLSAHYNIRQSTRPKLEKVLEVFKNASPEALDERYSKKIRVAEMSNRQNNWIGMIELARISRGWEFQFEDSGNDLSYVGFQVTL